MYPAHSTGKEPAFALRGIKGLWWEGLDKYRRALPWLAAHRMNFLMLCYSSFPASGADWRADYTAEEQQGLRRLAADAQRRGVNLCLSFNPGLWSKPPLSYSGEADYACALRKVRTVHGLGIRWFALCLDDIGRELAPEDKARFVTLQAAQVHFVNRLWRDMQALRPLPELIFCPSAYTTEDARQHLDYIQTIGTGIDPAVQIFWTGPQVCSPTITAADARQFAAWIRRKPFVWDNYPVNDMFPWRPLLAPVRGRAADLAGEVSGYLANPMKQWEVSRIPLATLADYLNRPADYAPAEALRRAIEDFPAGQRAAVRQLVALYGGAFWGEPGFPQQPRPAGREDAAHLLSDYRALRAALTARPDLADVWRDVQPTLEADIALLERKARDRLKEAPLHAEGDDFEGGAGELFGYRKYDRAVNYAYARSTGRDALRAEFDLATLASAACTLRLTARNDDFGNKPRLEIVLNDHIVYAGASPFTSAGFDTRDFAVPVAALRPGRSVLVIRNAEPTGPLGMPPWFMVAGAEFVRGER